MVDMRTLYDAVTPGNIPVSAQMVAGYVDGRYAWHANDWARFPNAVKVRIAVFSSTNDGHVLDIEPGCSTPASAPGWVQMRRRAGVDPSVYCNTSTWPTVRAAFAAAHVPEPHYWIASYPGIGPNLYAGSVAHQYADPGPVDISVVADYWPGVDGAQTGGPGGIASGTVHIPGAPTFPDATPTTAPAPQQEDSMIVLGGAGLPAYLIGSNGAVAALPNGEYLAAGLKMQSGETHSLTQRELDVVKNLVTVLRENKGF